MEKISELKQAVISGQIDLVQQLVADALEVGIKAESILKEGLIAALDIVGEKMSKDEFFIPEVLASAEAMKGGLNLITPHLAHDKSARLGKIVIGTVEGDVHDIGKNMVRMMLEGAGFEVIDLGINVPTQKFVEAVEAEKPDILALSSLYTPTMLAMRDVINALGEAGLRKQVSIMVGGAPVTQSFADMIGADGYADDATGAVTKARQFCVAAG